MTTLVSIVKTASVIADGMLHKKRTTYSVYASAMAEAGELGEEISIYNGDSYKQPSDDGVVGEAIDAIVALLDLIHVHDPNFTEDQLNEYAAKKSTKWLSRIRDQ